MPKQAGPLFCRACTEERAVKSVSLRRFGHIVSLFKFALMSWKKHLLFFLLLSLKTIASAALPAAIPPPDSCDWLTTTDGQSYAVKIIEERSDSVRFAFCADQERVLTLPRNKIKRIERGHGLKDIGKVTRLAKSALICGISSIALTFIFTLAGLVLAIVAITSGLKVLRWLRGNSSPEARKLRSKARTGIICACVSLLLLLFVLIIIVAVLAAL